MTRPLNSAPGVTTTSRLAAGSDGGQPAVQTALQATRRVYQAAQEAQASPPLRRSPPTRPGPKTNSARHRRTGLARPAPRNKTRTSSRHTTRIRFTRQRHNTPRRRPARPVPLGIIKDAGAGTNCNPPPACRKKRDWQAAVNPAFSSPNLHTPCLYFQSRVGKQPTDSTSGQKGNHIMNWAVPHCHS